MNTLLRQKIFVIALSLVLLLPLLLWAAGIRVSDIENTQATELPELSFAELSSGRYFQQLSDYIVAANVLRPQSIRINSIIEKNLFGQSSVKRVALGVDGWLFYAPAAQQSCGDISKLDASVEQLINIRDLLNKFDKQLVLGIAPNKRSVYPEREKLQGERGTSCADQLRQALRTKLPQLGERHFVDLQGLLEEERKYRPDIPLYTALDTHWTSYASAQFVASIMDRIDPLMRAKSGLAEVQSVTDIGDLSKMLADPQPQELQQFQFHAESEIEIKRLALEDSGALHVPQLYRSSSEQAQQNPKNILVLHDSFGETLCNQLPRVFNSVAFVHWSQFSGDKIASLIRNADVLLIEIVERDALNWLDSSFTQIRFDEKLGIALGSDGRSALEQVWYADQENAAANWEAVFGANSCQKKR